MRVTVTFNEKLPLYGKNEKGQQTLFDATSDLLGSGEAAATPMDILLEALGGCSMMDILSILKKMRKTIITLHAAIEAERAEEHPKVFTAIHVIYRLESPDCTLAEFEKATALSMEKYCSVAAMLRASGCSMTWSSELV